MFDTPFLFIYINWESLVMGYELWVLNKFLRTNDSVVAIVETPKYKFRDIKLF